MKKILFYFPGFSVHVGGSEYLLFSLMAALQGRYEISLAYEKAWVDIVGVMKQYGAGIDASKVKFVDLTPTRAIAQKIDRHLKFMAHRKLRKIGPLYDVCISCANPIDFGRPAIHFVHMLTLDPAFHRAMWKGLVVGGHTLRDKLVWLRDEVARFLSGARSAKQIVRNKREIVLPNSNYAKSCIERYYGCHIHPAFYPPTLFTPLSGVRRHPLDVACIGRVNPEKRVLEIIDIVDRARQKSGRDLHLRIAGHVPPDNSYTDYGDRIRARIVQSPWVILEGVLTGEEKARFLAECSYAVHNCKVEAFGISVTEYLKAGLVPIVPREGGSGEVVGIEDLVFESDEQAADLLARLVADTDFLGRCSQLCSKRATVFSASAYNARQQELLREMGIGEGGSCHD